MLLIWIVTEYGESGKYCRFSVVMISLKFYIIIHFLVLFQIHSEVFLQDMLFLLKLTLSLSEDARFNLGAVVDMFTLE